MKRIGSFFLTFLWAVLIALFVLSNIIVSLTFGWGGQKDTTSKDLADKYYTGRD